MQNNIRDNLFPIKVPPAEIEAVLMQHEGVRDVGVVGLPHPEAGELPVAFVVLQPGASPTEAELRQFVAERVSIVDWMKVSYNFYEKNVILLVTSIREDYTSTNIINAKV